MMAGLKINFNKSEVVMINDDNTWDSTYADIFNCQVGKFPINYLGAPISASRLHLTDWLPLIDKSNKRLDIAGRATLICCSLNNSPIYHMSVYLLPKITIDNIEKIRRTFFWQGVALKGNITCHMD